MKLQAAKGGMVLLGWHGDNKIQTRKAINFTYKKENV